MPTVVYVCLPNGAVTDPKILDVDCLLHWTEHQPLNELTTAYVPWLADQQNIQEATISFEQRRHKQLKYIARLLLH